MASPSPAQDHPVPRKLWEHPNPKSTLTWKFMQDCNKKRGLNMQTFQDLHDWSVGKRRAEFWEDVWRNVAGLVYEGSYEQVGEHYL
jgi:acetoacetyl-CoA synthetase